MLFYEVLIYILLSFSVRYIFCKLFFPILCDTAGSILLWYSDSEWVKKWYGHEGHMVDDKLIKMRYGDIVKGTRWGRLWRRRTDAVSEVFRARGISDVDVRRMIFDHVQWSHFVCKGDIKNGNVHLIWGINLVYKVKNQVVHKLVWKSISTLALWTLVEDVYEWTKMLYAPDELLVNENKDKR